MTELMNPITPKLFNTDTYKILRTSNLTDILDSKSFNKFINAKLDRDYTKADVGEMRLYLLRRELCMIKSSIDKSNFIDKIEGDVLITTLQLEQLKIKMGKNLNKTPRNRNQKKVLRKELCRIKMRNRRIEKRLKKIEQKNNE